jgi:hypothetical protein
MPGNRFVFDEEATVRSYSVSPGHLTSHVVYTDEATRSRGSSGERTLMSEMSRR